MLYIATDFQVTHHKGKRDAKVKVGLQLHISRDLIDIVYLRHFRRPHNKILSYVFPGLTGRPESLGCVRPVLGGLLVLGRVGLDGQAARVGRGDEAELDRRRGDLVRHSL